MLKEESSHNFSATTFQEFTGTKAAVLLLEDKSRH